MTRRKPYTKVKKLNQIRAPHVKGKGDKVFKVFQCLNPYCEEIIIMEKDKSNHSFKIGCPKCGFVHETGRSTKFYDYVLENIKNKEKIEEGEFIVSHEDYIKESPEFKYCIVCNALKPLRYFDKHSSRNSGRQGECRLCKKYYNNIKNQTRIIDQHREASQKRRLYLELTDSKKIDSEKIYQKYGYRCFKCGKNLKATENKKERHLDHTLPISYLWPLDNDNATLLCGAHNKQKSGKWPSEYYTDNELRKLAMVTGFDYHLLKGNPKWNPQAIKKLHDQEVVENLLKKYSAYIDEIISLRNKILKDTGFDFFSVSNSISNKWKKRADSLLKK